MILLLLEEDGSQSPDFGFCLIIAPEKWPVPAIPEILDCGFIFTERTITEVSSSVLVTCPLF